MSIYSLSQTLDDQVDLDSLCRDRALCTDECFEPNAFYGIGGVLRKYAGLPANHQLSAIIPHGIVFDRNYLWQAERLARIPVVLNYMGHRDEVYRLRTSKYVMSSASPFLYAMALEKNAPPVVRLGTIFFPAHSSHRLTAYAQYDDIADWLLALDDKFGPITVCIYWKDYLLGAHRSFLNRGIRVVSAGHIYDQVFLFRLYHLLRTHAYAASNAAGSHVFYSLAAGCKYFHLSDKEPQYEATKLHSRQDDSDSGGVPRVMRDLFSDPADLTSCTQRALYEELMGASNILSPANLKEQLLLAERLDQNGFAWDANGNFYWTCLPMAWWRSIYLEIRKLKRFLKK